MHRPIHEKLPDSKKLQAQRRGTSLTNPKQGALAAQANKPVKFAPESRKDEPLVVSII